MKDSSGTDHCDSLTAVGVCGMSVNLESLQASHCYNRKKDVKRRFQELSRHLDAFQLPLASYRACDILGTVQDKVLGRFPEDGSLNVTVVQSSRYWRGEEGAIPPGTVLELASNGVYVATVHKLIGEVSTAEGRQTDHGGTSYNNKYLWLGMRWSTASAFHIDVSWRTDFSMRIRQIPC